MTDKIKAIHWQISLGSSYEFKGTKLVLIDKFLKGYGEKPQISGRGKYSILKEEL